jgi:hypothetical protein
VLRAAAGVIFAIVLVVDCPYSNASGTTVEVDGVIPDPDKVSNCLAGLPANPTLAQRGRCLGAGLVGNHAVKLDVLNIEATSDAKGRFVMHVPTNNSIRFIFPGDTTYEPTLGNEVYAVGTTQLTGIPAHAMGKYEGATTPVIAIAANTTAYALTRQGLCILDVLKVHSPPDIENAENVTLTVTETGFDVYAVGGFTTTGPTNITKSNISPAGRFAITKASLSRETTIHVQAVANGLTFAPATCAIRPGVVTFAPYGAIEQ